MRLRRDVTRASELRCMTRALRTSFICRGIEGAAFSQFRILYAILEGFHALVSFWIRKVKGCLALLGARTR
jgi:hypothetical protein